MGIIKLEDVDGKLHWSVVFEVPLPSVGRDFTIFQHSGVILGTRELTNAQRYRATIHAIAAKFLEWENISSNIWKETEDVKEVP